jgi:uncharacterized membrane protein YfcA
MSLATVLLLVVLSLAVGLLMGALGGGGGGFYLVILIFALKLPPAEAVGSSLVLSAITLAGASIQYWRAGLVRRDYFAVLAAAGALSVVAGSFLLKGISEAVLKPGIIVVFLLSGASSLLRLGRGKMGAAGPKPARQRAPALVGIGAFAGLLSGIFGLSGTTPLTSLLIGAFDLDPREAVGTTTLVTLVISLAGGLFHLGAGSLDLRTIVIFGSGSLLGAAFGAKLAQRLNRKLITAVIATMALASGIFLAFKH